MGFGSKIGSIQQLKAATKKGSGNGTYIQYIPKETDGTISVRFIQEPDEWILFKECFDQVRRRSYPVPPDESMPGYPGPDDRVSSRYLANAVVLEHPKVDMVDKVVPLQLPRDLVNQLVVRYEKYGSVCDRDYELGRSGSGLDTTYYCTPEPAMQRPLDKYDLHDLEQILQDAYESVFGASSVPSGISTESKPQKAKPSNTAKRRKQAQEDRVEEPDDVDDDIEEDDDDGVESGTDAMTLAEQADNGDDDAAVALTELADEAGVDPDDYDTWVDVVEAIIDDDEEEDEDDPEDDEEEADEYTEAELKTKQVGDLRSIAREHGVVTKGMKKSQLIKSIIEHQEEPF